MMDRQQMADVLLSAWVLATAQPGQRARRLPTGQGVLDRALKRTIEDGHFPEEFRRLRFVETRLGVRCPDLRAILAWAQAAEQTTDPNPSYLTTEVKFSPRAAERMLAELEVDSEMVKEWGNALANAIDEERVVSVA